MPMPPQRRAALGGIKLIILLLLAAMLGGAVGYFGLARRAGADGKRPAAETKAASAKAAAAEREHVTHVDMGAFLVNLGSLDMVRYLRTDITLGITGLKPDGGKGGHEGHGGDDVALPHALDARVRDAIVRVLSAQSFENMRARGPDEALKQAILDELTACMDRERAVAVLFTSFVMQ